MATPNNNETVHISLGTTANYITSHLLNLQGLAATSSSGTTNNNNEGCHSKSLCDPSVTHDISPVDDTNVYSSSRSGRSSSYVYVPRALIVDGRDSFGPSWGGVSYNQSQSYETSSTSTSAAGGYAWNGTVSLFNASDHSDILFGSSHEEQQNNDDRIPHHHQHTTTSSHEQLDDDPLHKFHTAASIMGLSQQYSRFNASPPSQYITAGGNSSSSRHVQWDENDDDEEEEEDDDYCYGRSDEDIREEKRRQLEKMEDQQMEDKKSWNRCMEDAWEEAFSSENTSSMMSIGSNEMKNNATTDNVVGGDTTAQALSTSNDSTTANNDAMGLGEREIQWYDYWMPPKPSPTKYRVPLPFDTAYSSKTNTTTSKKSVWSTSFNMGYNPSSSGGGENNSVGITNSWREDVLSESLRKVLEESDVLKGFNIFVDGGSHNYHGITKSTSNDNHTNNRHAKNQLSNIMTGGGGGFHAGLATSLLEELSEECKSAGRWVVMADPLLSSSSPNTTSNTTEGNQNQIHRFRQSLNAGLALHGLSTNADAFLPVSID